MTLDNFVTVEELTDLLRSHGVLPPQQRRLRRAAGKVDDHGHLHSPKDGKFISKGGSAAAAVKGATKTAGKAADATPTDKGGSASSVLPKDRGELREWFAATRDPLGMRTEAGEYGGSTGSARIGKDDGHGVNLYGEVYHGDRFVYLETGAKDDVHTWPEPAVLLAEDVPQLGRALREAGKAAETGKAFEKVIEDASGGEITVSVKPGDRSVSFTPGEFDAAKLSASQVTQLLAALDRLHTDPTYGELSEGLPEAPKPPKKSWRDRLGLKGERGGGAMARDDDYVTVDELFDLLRSYGVLPSQNRTVPASAARLVLDAFDQFATERYERARVPKLTGKALEEFNLKHPRGPGGRFGSGSGGGGGGRVRPRPSARQERTDPDAVLSKLKEGKAVRADPSIIDDLMKRISADGTVFNLAKLNVAGKGNANLFQRHLRDRPRETMPQLPTETGRQMDEFMQFLLDKNVKFEFGKIDPRKLVASQSELNGPKVAKLYGFMRDGGWKRGGVMIISKDGAVIDGHHRWAGAAAASIARGGTMEVTVMKIDALLDEILGTDENPNGIVMDFAKFESLATDREA